MALGCGFNKLKLLSMPFGASSGEVRVKGALLGRETLGKGPLDVALRSLCRLFRVSLIASIIRSLDQAKVSAISLGF
ncbi:hypothetical protein D9M68_46960 [compost metagenome]